MVLSNSVLLGFPYADVEEMGGSVVVVTDNEPVIAQQLANNLADYMEAKRHQFVGKFLDVRTAVEQSMQLEGPVLLLDMGDNVGGGAPGDGTAIAHEILRVTIRFTPPGQRRFSAWLIQKQLRSPTICAWASPSRCR